MQSKLDPVVEYFEIEADDIESQEAVTADDESK